MAKTEPLLAGLRCLVLEDEFLIALDLQDILETAGAAVTCHADADEALRVLRQGARFDLAILDVRLGGATRTSYSVAAALTAQGTPFVFLTGMRRDATIAAEFPRVAVLEKPYQQAQLLEAIRAAQTLK